MSLIKEPLIFIPVYKDYLWGGAEIAKQFKRAETPEPCAESWEISAHPDGMSIVAEGSLKGSSLDELAKRFGTELTGTLAPQSDRFPLLFKIIDARRKLSVQVHPNNANARLTEGQSKSEMWYVLECGQDSSLYAGVIADATRQSVEAALSNGSVAEQLVELKVQPDQALYIPGGLVHAIGEGCLIYEVQQNSNTTYRLFDWNRTDTDGNPRQLHIAESLATIDWDLKPPAMITPAPDHKINGASWSNVVSCDFFAMRKLDLNGSTEVRQDGSTFTALFVTGGATELACGDRTLHLHRGASALIPAAVESFTVKTTEQTSMLVTTLQTAL